ncbi:MAG: SUMF1/EgtB/PvdO family nonheme iron enzyme [Deltaproteobacteria bacterium]|nr:SUMF1/EgtB/PvdO family nonheme iron enzyme [Deltaproteobacteria bacterium]
MKRLLDILLPALVIAAALPVAYLELRPWLQSPDTLPVSLSAGEGADALHPLDRLLLQERFAIESSGLLPALANAEDGPRIRTLWVDACEVSQGAFRKFAQWLDFQPASRRRALRFRGKDAPAQPRNWKFDSSTRRHRISGRLDAPVSGVTFYDAHAYCKAAGGRLPSAAEWQAIAAGQSGRLYPWGGNFDEAPWPYLEPLLNAAQPCGLHPSTNTPEAVHDLGSGVSEWSSGPRGVGPAIHGGNGWQRPYALHALSLAWRPAHPAHRSPYTGFRCVYNSWPGPPPWRTRSKVRRVPRGQYPPAVPPAARAPRLLPHLPAEDLPLLPVLLRGAEQTGAARLSVMRREVTRAEYARFLRDPLARFGLYADPGEPKSHSYTPQNWAQQMRHPQRPVTGVDWWSAHAYARWAGGRLPHADEWVQIASGARAGIRPWGDPYAPHAVTLESRRQAPQRTGAAPGDRSQDGILDLAGNVSEWTATYQVGPGGYAMLVKGGNYTLPGPETTRVSFTTPVPPNHRAPTLGFRVVFDR